MKKQKIAKIITALLIVLTLAFIWSESLKPVSVSEKESAGVMEVIRPFLELFVGKGNVTDHLVRKLAHFTEYSVLGVTMAAWAYLNRTQKLYYALLIPAGFLAGSIDETIQYFVGRGNQFSDVMLDLGGFIFGAIVLHLAVFAIKRPGKSE